MANKTQAVRNRIWPKRRLPSGGLIRSVMDKPFPRARRAMNARERLAYIRQVAVWIGVDPKTIESDCYGNVRRRNG